MIGIIDRRYAHRVRIPVAEYDKLDVVDSVEGVQKVKISKGFPLREDGTIDELPVDQFSGQDFMRNPNGFITNDIMMFEECQSDSVARAVLNRLKILHPENVDQSLTVDEMLTQVMPSNYGSPAEYVSAHHSMIKKVSNLFDKYSKENAERMAKEAADRAAAEADSLKNEKIVNVEPET